MLSSGYCFSSSKVIGFELALGIATKILDPYSGCSFSSCLEHSTSSGTPSAGTKLRTWEIQSIVRLGAVVQLSKLAVIPLTDHSV